MITRIYTEEEIKELFIETLMNNTTAITKVSKHSVNNGIAYGVSKIARKCLKEVVLAESLLFPNEAFSSNLDYVAEFSGISARFGASVSTTFVRLVGVVGTIYLAGVNQITGSSGIIFDLEDDVTIPSSGFIYAKVRSTTTGKKTNVEPFSLNTISPSPTGHLYLINEFMATGGADIEDDNSLRLRIKEGPNLAAVETLNRITQALIKINSNVLKVFYQGMNSLGQIVLAVVTQNGEFLSQNELNTLLAESEKYFSLTDLRYYQNQLYKLSLTNISWQELNISFRIGLLSGYNSDDIRKEIQIKIAKYLDFRFWDYSKNIEWDNLLQIVKSIKGVSYVPDQYFYLNGGRIDLTSDRTKLPRLKGFLMLDLNGDIIIDISGVLNPIYYPNSPDLHYQETFISDI